jgi:FixJ family two-component response regulator
MKIRSDIPIIMCTGFSELVTPEQAKEMGIREFLKKPIIGSELGETIRRILNEEIRAQPQAKVA